MARTLRAPEILEIARTEGKVTVDGLAARFGVSVQTIRRNLSDMAEAGQLQRVHGGAVLPSGVRNIAYLERRALHGAAKDRIGAAVARAIPDDCSLFLNIGTTTESVARHLHDHRNLLVITNNLNIVEILASAPQVSVVVTGGTLRAADNGLTGPIAAATVSGYKTDFAVIGCSAVDRDGDLLDFDADEVTVSRAILANARRKILVMDASKLQRTAPLRIARMSQLDTVYTNAPLPLTLRHACQITHTRIEVVAP